MRKIFSLIAAVLFAGSMMATDPITINASDITGIESGATTGLDATVQGVQIVWEGAYYNSEQQGCDIRVYANKTLTLTAPDNITKVEIAGYAKKDLAVSVDHGTVTTGASFASETTKKTLEEPLIVVEGVNSKSITFTCTKQMRAYIIRLTFGEASEPVVAPYCQTEVGHFFAANADPNSFVLLSIGSKGGKTIVRIDQDAAKNTQMFDYLQVTNLATDGADVAEGGATAMAVEFATPDAVNDSITLEILWSTVNWEGRWMVQNVKVPATAACEYAVLVPAPVAKKTCAEVYDLAKNDAVALNDVVVTFANGKNVWVKDATASMLVFLPAASDAFKAGDVLSEVAGVVDIYNGVYEVKPTADQVTDIVATPGAAPAAEVVAEVAATDVNKYIVMQNVEFAEDAAFAEGTQSNITINGVTVRNQFKNGYSFTAGKKYNIYGVVTIYSSKPQVYFITAEVASGTAIDNTVVSEKAIKMFENGQLIIIKNGVKYNALGSVIE